MNARDLPAKFVITPEVASARVARQPIVALESTIFSALGLPAPQNRAVLDDCLTAVRDAGAVPAVCAVIDGIATVGVTADHFERVLNATVKLAERDLPVAIARGQTGVTTVSATLALAAHAEIDVFATGGIGGVHRNANRTGDISADLAAIARHPVVTVSAGAKGFLDLARTVEFLETLGVPVLGWQTDEFPAFWSRTSGVRIGSRVEDADTVARAVRAARELAITSGFLVVAPCPPDEAIPHAELEPVIDSALARCAAAGVSAAAITPFVLDEIFRATAGRSIVANRALAVQNAQIAAEVSTALGRASL